MATADWGVFGCFLLLAALLGWLEIRYMMGRDTDPAEESRWPEWWTVDPSEGEGVSGHGVPWSLEGILGYPIEGRLAPRSVPV